MTEMPDDLRADLNRYQELVRDYEALDQRIDDLLASYGGNVDQMSGQDKQHYRELFRQRDELLNDMRFLEQTLIDPDESM
ncbi:MAG: FAD-binding oxidoreductase [Chloroflexi bacterium]|nr:FAD-binding oxidoreductase [Chloroflexota bacterium]